MSSCTWHVNYNAMCSKDDVKKSKPFLFLSDSFDYVGIVIYMTMNVKQETLYTVNPLFMSP